MDIFDAEMELGLEPGELSGTFPAEFVKRVSCKHDALTPHRKWDSGSWYWTCNDCYNIIPNRWVTDKMREAESNHG